jgi:hypothetical protein
VKWSRRLDAGTIDRNAVADVLVAELVSALVTDSIGIHAMFRAFFMGGVIPHDTRLARVLEERIADLVTILLLPPFFAMPGCERRSPDDRNQGSGFRAGPHDRRGRRHPRVAVGVGPASHADRGSGRQQTCTACSPIKFWGATL